jgi:LacI family repressor for deo operon, udp, cdd, tsx, nupC, and nupG
MAGPDAGHRRATMVDVAREAGVSHQTVSRYLRGAGGLRPSTVERIERAIRGLDYRPNLLARSMRTRRTNRIAIVMPAATGSVFPTRTIGGAAAAAHAEGFLLDIVGLEGPAAERLERVRRLLDSEGVEGILSLAPLDGLDRSLRAGGPPVVVAGDYDDDLHARRLLADGSFTDELVGHLQDLGHRVLVHLAGSPQWASARNRRTVYERSVADRGLISRGVLGGEWSARSGYAAVAGLPDDTDVTAVVAANDTLAVGALRAAADRGWSVPGRLSVVGWDDDEASAYLTLALTTVSVYREGQGREAMNRLLALVRGRSYPARPVTLHRLVVRESSGPAPDLPAGR